MELFESFKTVKDPRKNINKKHGFIDILFLTISAVVSGALGWKDINHMLGFFFLMNMLHKKLIYNQLLILLCASKNKFKLLCLTNFATASK